MTTSVLLSRTRELLKETLIPASKIAKVVGCNQKTVANIREGTNVPTVEICEAIFTLLNNNKPPRV